MIILMILFILMLFLIIRLMIMNIHVIDGCIFFTIKILLFITCILGMVYITYISLFFFIIDNKSSSSSLSSLSLSTKVKEDDTKFEINNETNDRNSKKNNVIDSSDDSKINKMKSSLQYKYRIRVMKIVNRYVADIIIIIIYRDH